MPPSASMSSFSSGCLLSSIPVAHSASRKSYNHSGNCLQHGWNKHRVDYRHIIDRLVRKPGAFENYRYKDELFPTSQFRIAHDLLRNQHGPKQGIKEYLKILELAAKENQQAVNEALRLCIAQQVIISSQDIKQLVESDQSPPPITDVYVEPVDITLYDELLQGWEVLV